jgi:hypothetical protein
MWGKRIFAAALAAALISGATHAADWTAKKGEDPMRHRPYAWMFAPLDSGPGQVLAFMCWDDGNGTVQVVVQAGPTHDDGTIYKKMVSAKFRIDKNEPVDVMLVATNADGRLSYGITGAQALSLLKRVGTAKQRIIFEIATGAVRREVSAQGVAEAAELLDKTCKLPTVILP